MHVEPFTPRSGVHVETDPKATSVSRASAMGDDEGVISEYVKKLEARSCACPHLALVMQAASDEVLHTAE